MTKAIEKIKKEIKEHSRWLGKCQSRWLNGYVDGLKDALKILEETYGKKEDLRKE